MKKVGTSILALAMVLCLGACGEQDDGKSYYSNTELEKLETFTSITGIELNTSEDEPETGYVIYHYIMDNDADGERAVTTYETYLTEYGFEKFEELSTDDVAIYMMDGYMIITLKSTEQLNVIQYEVSIPGHSAASEGK